MNTQRNRERFDSELVLKASSTETANTTGEAKAFYSIPETCMAKVYTSELSGTDPTLDVTIEGSNDNSQWMPIAKFPPIGEVGKVEIPFGPKAFKYYRYTSELDGTTPSFTYYIFLSN